MTAKCSPHMIVTMMKLPLVAIVLILLKEVGGITGQYVTYIQVTYIITSHHVTYIKVREPDQ